MRFFGKKKGKKKQKKRQKKRQKKVRKRQKVQKRQIDIENLMFGAVTNLIGNLLILSRKLIIILESLRHKNGVL